MTTVTVVLDDDGNVFVDVTGEADLATALGVLRLGEVTLAREAGA